MCREKLHIIQIVIQSLGSPLRVQGKAFVVHNLKFVYRITPACAGKRLYYGYSQGLL